MRLVTLHRIPDRHTREISRYDTARVRRDGDVAEDWMGMLSGSGSVHLDESSSVWI